MKRFYSFNLYLYNHRVARFIISGGTAVAANITVLFVLVHFFHMWYLLSAVISFSTAVLVSFMLQKFFTFNDYSRSSIGRQATFYLGFQILNLSLNTLFMYIGVDLLRIQYILAQILIASVMAVSNFFIYKHLVFIPDTVYNEN